MSRAPLAWDAAEVLKALAVGVRLQRVDGAWTFVGPSQDAAQSQVSEGLVKSLIDGGLVSEHGKITEDGHKTLKAAIADDTRRAFEWMTLSERLRR